MDDLWTKLDPDGRLRASLTMRVEVLDKTRWITQSSDVLDVPKGVRSASALSDVVRRYVEPLGKIALPSNVARIGMPVDLGRRLRDAWEAALAPNWHDLDADEVMAALSVMVDDGLNVAWAPRAELVRLLIAASDTRERDVILVARAGDVLDDVEANLSIITWDRLGAPVEAVREALASCRDGRYRSCVALMAVVITGTIHGPLGCRAFSDARKRYETLDPEQATLSMFRLAAVLRCLHRAILRTDEWSGLGFNRHAAAHGLDAEAYTHANAMAALLLAVGVLRELDRAASVGERGALAA